jgi:alpha-tubulin suppressor-like RCC1 family protein
MNHMVRWCLGLLIALGTTVVVSQTAYAGSDIVPLGWGNNAESQIAKSKSAVVLTPEAAPTAPEVAGHTVTSLDLHSLHACAVTEEREVTCWGSNSFGQLGRDPADDSTSPGRPLGIGVSVGIPIAEVAVGDWHTCAVSVSGEVFCWGRNQYGQTGGSDKGSQPWRPTKVEGFPEGTRVSQVTLGEGFSCALTDDGAVFCWGRNANGQLGVAGGANAAGPKRIDGLPDGVTFTNLSAGSRHVCGTGSDGVAYCWGMNRFGQAGVSPTEEPVVETPQAVPFPADAGSVASVSSGRWHTCATTENGTAYCWGHNRFGQLGNSTQENSSAPVTVTGAVTGVPLSGVTAGGSHSCAWGVDSSIFCWGDNSSGQIGDGTQVAHLAAVKTASADTDKLTRPALGVVAGRDSSVALYGYSAKPGTPRNVALAGTSLSWVPPLYGGQGSAALTQYRISVTPPTADKAVTFATVPASVTSMDLAGACPQFGVCVSSVGLDQGQTYRWTVAAIGADTTGSSGSRIVAAPWSGPSLPPVEKPGSPPSSPFITGLDGTTLNWTFPEFTGAGQANLAMYSIRISVAGTGTPKEFMSIPASTTSVDLTAPCPMGGACRRPLELLSGVGYEMRVYAVGANSASSTWPRGVESSYFVWP